MQVSENIKVAIGYFSRGLTDVESRYAIYDLKVRACAESLIYTQQFFEGIKFELFVNNKGLSTCAESVAFYNSSQLAKHQMVISQLSGMEIKHIAGHKSFFVDILFRFPEKRALYIEPKERSSLSAYVQSDYAKRRLTLMRLLLATNCCSKLICLHS